jgi:hypothetical protein
MMDLSPNQGKIMPLLRKAWALTASAAIALTPNLAAQAQNQTAAAAPVDLSKHPLLGLPGIRYSPQLQMKMVEVVEQRLQAQGKTKPEIDKFIVKSSGPTTAAASLALDELINPDSQKNPKVYASRLNRATVAQLPVSSNSAPDVPMYIFVIPVAQAMQEPVAVCVEMPVGMPAEDGKYKNYEIVYHGMIMPSGELKDISWTGERTSSFKPDGAFRRACASYAFAVAQKYDECQKADITQDCMKRSPEDIAAAQAQRAAAAKNN